MKAGAKLRRLQRRIKDWEQNGDKGKHQMHRPGSRKK